MQRAEFESRIRELLPGASETALGHTVITYAEELERASGTMCRIWHFYDAFYVESGLGETGPWRRDRTRRSSTAENISYSTFLSCAVRRVCLTSGVAHWNRLRTASIPWKTAVTPRMPEEALESQEIPPCKHFKTGTSIFALKRSTPQTETYGPEMG